MTGVNIDGDVSGDRLHFSLKTLPDAKYLSRHLFRSPGQIRMQIFGLEYGGRESLCVATLIGRRISLNWTTMAISCVWFSSGADRLARLLIGRVLSVPAQRALDHLVPPSLCLWLLFYWTIAGEWRLVTTLERFPKWH